MRETKSTRFPDRVRTFRDTVAVIGPAPRFRVFEVRELYGRLRKRVNIGQNCRRRRNSLPAMDLQITSSASSGRFHYSADFGVPMTRQLRPNPGCRNRLRYWFSGPAIDEFMEWHTFRYCMVWRDCPVSVLPG